jgi:hypothetical protein
MLSRAVLVGLVAVGAAQTSVWCRAHSSTSGHATAWDALFHMRSRTHAVERVLCVCQNAPTTLSLSLYSHHIIHPHLPMSHRLHAHLNVQPKIETVGADLVTTIPQGNYYANLYGGEFKAT